MMMREEKSTTTHILGFILIVGSAIILVALMQGGAMIYQERQIALQTAPAATTTALEAHYQKGIAYMNIGRWQEAQAELEQVFEVDPNYKDVQARLVEVYTELKKMTPTSPPTPKTPSPTLTLIPPTSTQSPTPSPPTLTPTPLPDPVFWDDFEDEARTQAQWTLADGRINSWRVVNGVYASQESFARSVAGDINWQDYIFLVDVMNTQGPDKVITFRDDTLGNLYQFDLRSAGFNDLSLARGLDGMVGKTQFLQRVPVNNRNGVWYRLKIVAIGNHIQVYVDDTLYIDYIDHDAPILNGRIGITSWADNAIQIDNVKVILLPNANEAHFD